MRRVVVASGLASVTVGCSLLASFDGLSGGGSDPPGIEAGADGAADAAPSDGGDAEAPDAARRRELLVVVGGFAPGGGTAKETALVAPVHEDGGVGDWSPSALLVQSSFWSRYAVGVGARAFVVGHPTSFVGSFAPGAAPTWAVGEGLERTSYCTAASGDEIFVLGGKDPANEVIDVVSVARASTTRLAWTTTKALPEARHFLGEGCAATDAFVYVASGKDGAGAHQDQVWVAPRLPGGGVGAWASTTPLPSAAFAVHLVAVGSRLVLVGGSFDTVDPTSVYSAQIGADGKLGAWQIGQALPFARDDYTVTAVGRRIFAIGGTTADVLTTTLDEATGLMQPWTATTALPEPRTHASSVAVSVP